MSEDRPAPVAEAAPPSATAAAASTTAASTTAGSTTAGSTTAASTTAAAASTTAGTAAADAQRARRRRLAAALPAAALAAIAAWEAIAAPRAGAGVPGDEAWARAAAVVRAGHRPGDLVVFAPDWIDPVGRLHLGDLAPIEHAARMDAARFGRIWELSIRGARAADTAGLAPALERDEGGVRVRRFERAPAEVLADVRELVPRARVEGRAARAPRVELAEVGFTPRRCVLAVPTPGAPLRVTFPALPAGELVGYAGLADVFTRRDERRPGRVAVEQGGRELAAVTPGVDDGWVRFAARIAAGDVTFVLGSAGPNRQICFAAEVRR